jgi:predicted ATPase
LDQPEDDLDNQMIYTVIVEELRRNKRNRQVILVTHNPNLVVNGNADMIFPLDASEGPTQLRYSGTLQNPHVRDAVCRVMEGGERALEQRFRRMISTVNHSQ